MTAALVLLTLAFAGTAFGNVLFTPRHLGEREWPRHATTHVVQGLAWLVGLAVVGLVLVWGPLRTGEWWAAWAVLLVAAFLHGGFLVPLLLREPWRVIWTDLWYTGVALAAVAGALVLAWPHLG
jgi:hypothetical protein